MVKNIDAGKDAHALLFFCARHIHVHFIASGSVQRRKIRAVHRRFVHSGKCSERHRSDDVFHPGYVQFHGAYFFNDHFASRVARHHVDQHRHHAPFGQTHRHP